MVYRYADKCYWEIVAYIDIWIDIEIWYDIWLKMLYCLYVVIKDAI